MFYVGLYLVAIIAANLLFSIVLNPESGYKLTQQLLADFAICFAFIGFDIGIRDKLHEQWKHNRLLLKMLLLILSGSMISFAVSYWLNAFDPNTVMRVALASFLAFSSASLIDFAIYHSLRYKPLWMRIHGSNLPSAAVDSLVFPMIAFGFPLMWSFVAVEFIAKIIGGFIFGWILINAKCFKNHP